MLVRRKFRDRLLVRALSPEQGAGDSEIGSVNLGKLHLFHHLGHSRPGVEDVRDAVPVEAGEVFGGKELLVADFDRIAEGGGKCGEKWIQRRDKFASVAI